MRVRADTVVVGREDAESRAAHGRDIRLEILPAKRGAERLELRGWELCMIARFRDRTIDKGEAVKRLCWEDRRDGRIGRSVVGRKNRKLTKTEKFVGERGAERLVFNGEKEYSVSKTRESSEARSGDVPSGTRVTAQPPPPAPVSLVLSLYGSLPVFSRIISSVSWDTPSDTRYE